MYLLGCKLSAYSGISSYLKIHRHFGHIDEKIVWEKISGQRNSRKI